MSIFVIFWDFGTTQECLEVSGVLHFKFAIGSGEVVLKNQISWFYLYSTHNSDRPEKVKKSREKNQFFNKCQIYRLQAREKFTRARDFFQRLTNIWVISHFNLVDIRNVLMILWGFKSCPKLYSFGFYLLTMGQHFKD